MQNQTFELKSSNYYLIALSGVFALGLYFLYSSSVSFYVKGLVTILCCIYAIQVARQHALLRSQHAIRTIEYKGEDLWLVQTNSSSYLAKLKGDSTVTNLVSVLRFIIPGQKFPQTCLIFCDALPAESYRHLLRTLKFL